MAIEERRVTPLLGKGMILAVVISILVLIFREPIAVFIYPPLKTFVNAYVSLLLNLLFCVFFVCSSLLILIMCFLVRESKVIKSLYKRYITALVCAEYYKEEKRVHYDAVMGSAVASQHKKGLDVEKDLSENKGDGVRRTYYSDEDIIKEANRNGPFNGMYKTYYPGGKLEKEVSLKEGKLDGILKTYYENGQVHQEKTFIDGKLDGIFKAYDEMGLLYFDIEYKNGQQHGIENIYFRGGGVQYRDTHKYGIRINRKTYDEGGALKFDHDFHFS